MSLTWGRTDVYPIIWWKFLINLSGTASLSANGRPWTTELFYYRKVETFLKLRIYTSLGVGYQDPLMSLIFFVLYNHHNLH